LPGGSIHSDKPAKAAGVIIGFVGVLGLLGSLAAAAVTFSPEVTTSMTTEAVLGVAAVSALLSLVVLAGGWQSYKKKRWYFGIFTAIVASIVVSPLGLPALVLLALAEPSFD
jgi:heme/copper-type cytochrome/quinol oxidase subunit 4